MPNTAAAPLRGRIAGFLLCTALVVLAGCGDSTVPQTAAGQSLPPLTAVQCLAAAAPAQNADPALLATASQVRAWQEQVDQFDHGFRPTGSDAEQAYIDQLAAQLTAMGASDVVEEPYGFTQWTAQTATLSLIQGGASLPIKIAAYMPYSGQTGVQGVEGPLLYLPEFTAADVTGALLGALQQRDPLHAVSLLLSNLDDFLSSTVSGVVSLTQFLAAHDFRGQVVVYDVPRVTLPLGVFTALASYVNNSSGTSGPLVPYSRPYIDMLFTILINRALMLAGASAAIGVIDYPPTEADGSYYPFSGMGQNAIPLLYLDRATGAALKQQILAGGPSLPRARLTLTARTAQAVSHNLSAVIPGRCPQQFLLSSHVDGTNSIEDNGPAAILAIAAYFLKLPPAQRLRSVRIVLTSGHFVGSAGIDAYIKAHQADLSAQVLAAIEIEHLGAREWLELSPGAMALDGLPEPQVLMAEPGHPLGDEARKFAMRFDRAMSVPPFLPVGEGLAWNSQGGLPLLAFITGPVYLLNQGMPEITSEYTDYGYMSDQIAAFIQMIHNLDAQPVSALRPDLGG